jgi:hypothetical protein
MEFRTEPPDLKEFKGPWPRTIQAVAVVGIKGADGEFIDKRWALATWIHTSPKYKLSFEAGANEHWVKYQMVKWTPLDPTHLED